MENIEKVNNAKLMPIKAILNKYGISDDYIINYGKYIAKIDIDNLKNTKAGKLILVTSISPTIYGEGKTTTAIGLVDALNKLDKNAVAILREPALGPVFGTKGGATGGGCAKVIPSDDINLHFTGDMSAICTANNLLCAIIDNHIFQGNELKIKKVVLPRTIDINDRALRNITINSSYNREDHFILTVASELMACVCLANDFKELKEMVANMIVAYNDTGKPIYTKDLQAVEAVCILLKETIKPNVVQTLEHNLAIIHGGPFANIAHGCNSIIATKMAMTLGDVVVTEAGFGADLGAEKFLDIKCRKAGIKPDAVVIVATIKALKYHGGIEKEKWYICPDGEQTGYKYELINSNDTMQFLKGDIQEGILKAAEEVFLEKGYKDASMREIASRAGVTVSNIYHYFTNKDEIFRTILKPVLNDLYAMIYNHDADQMTIDVFMDSDYQKMSVREYIRLVSEHRDRLRLLLFQAQGSVLENFRSEYTDLMTRTISVFFQGMKQKYPHINIAITNFFIHLNTVWLFALLEELVLHPVKKEEMEKFIAEYIAFETAGWKELMNA